MELQYHISPAIKLVHQRCKAREKHRYEYLRSASDVEIAIRQKRKDYLGRGLELEVFVRNNNQPVESAVFHLSQYLGAQASYDLSQGTLEEMAQFCATFYYDCLQLYAHGCIGDDSFDDLIRLAEVYAQDPDILVIIAQDDLSWQISQEWTEWLSENNRAPSGFITATIGAVAALQGVLPEKTT